MDSTFKKFFFIFLLVIPVVLMVFMIIPDKKVAALIAGTLFIVAPTVFLLSVFKNELYRKPILSFGFIMAILFLVFSALPIFLLRVFNWDVPFVDLTIMGIPAPMLHQVSNTSYLLMVVATGIDYWRLKSKKIA